MNSSDLDKILADERTIAVSAGFTARVMRTVRLHRHAGSRTTRPSGLGQALFTAAALALASAFVSQELGAVFASTPTLNLELAQWLSLIVPSSLAVAFWSSQLLIRG